MPSWWRSAVIYQIYIRSFADGNGDGIGDIPGIRTRLPYLKDLGVDAIWITPWYPSPMADGGYDVADYRDVDPLFGTLDDAVRLVEDAHGLGIRVILDVVANHSSDRHPWFRTALAAPPHSPERDRYIFRDGRGPEGAKPPNDWISAFGGSAWTRVTEPDGRPGQWYLHLFAPTQPDFNWANEDVRREFDAILRFWFDLGIDGIRVDAAPAFAKDPLLPDFGHQPGAPFAGAAWEDNPHWDVDEVHDIFRAWRKISDEYADRMFVGEAVVNGPERLARYVRPDEFHTVFNFDYLKSPWDASILRAVIDGTLSALHPVGAPATWVLSSHDETRHLTRYGRANTEAFLPGQHQPELSDLQLGTRRARAAALLMLALPGGAYIYQGEELGLWEVEDLPEELLQDPTWERSGHTIRGRDGCRVPIPWSGDAPPFGFGPPGSTPWLPHPAAWRQRTVEAETGDPASMLELYRTALRIRRDHLGFTDDTMRWMPAPEGVLHFERGAGLRCVVNLSNEPFRLPTEAQVLLASTPLDGDRLQPDAAAWFRTR